jgi:hypothetical protein
MIQPNYSYRAITNDIAEEQSNNPSHNQPFGDLVLQLKPKVVYWLTSPFLMNDALKISNVLQTITKALMLMRHVVHCILSALKISL